MKIRRIGVLTAGGDCPGLNAVVRGVAKHALNCGIEVLGFKNGFDGLVKNQFIELDAKAVSGILTRGGTILGTSNLANPFNYTLPPIGSPEDPKDVSSLVLHTIKSNKVDALVTIGGDGTLSMSQKFIELGVPIVGVPKTIDNDLSATDFTFGFDSALSVATDAVDRIHTTAESHHRVMILETMGRYAGWIALRSCIAGGGDICLIPEIPYSEDAIVEAIESRQRKGKTFSIIVAAEGAVNEQGEMAVKSTIAGSTDPIRLGGISSKIAAMVEERLKVECRVVVLGHLQRGGTPTAFDRWLSTRFGTEAVELILQGKTGYMVALRGTEIVSVPVKDAVSKLKRVDPNGEEVRSALAVGTSFGSNKVGDKCGV
ncbi:6-phosphofructokinase [Candidatus Proelusimicrobium excrementi]|uniref:6-phosphofructokinase n=1 Tax=Candidatus Proelusimicrobium excrementi TaxID=3416222 RepID=UPI003C9359B2|nr:6-phosphofructokinase [Elusimicrobiaceae bacterium]